MRNDGGVRFVAGPVHSPADSDPLLARVAGARLVLLGEANHGTHEFYRLREQLTRRLIAEWGYSFVAVEGDWPDCDRDALAAVADAYRCFEPYGRRPEEYARATRFVRSGCEPEVVRLLGEARLRAALDGAGEFGVWQNAEVVAGAERYYRAMVRGGQDSWNVRDTHMADTLDRLLDHYGPHAKAVVWAHNSHVGDARATDMAAAGMVNIGELARERHGSERVVLVGFGSHRGQVIAAPAWGAPHEVMPVPPARPDSLEDRLHATVPDRSLMVFPARARPAWLDEERDHRAIGVVYHPAAERWGNYVPTRLGDRYDAFIWCDESGPLRPLHAQPAPGELETYPSGV